MTKPITTGNKTCFHCKAARPVEEFLPVGEAYGRECEACRDKRTNPRKQPARFCKACGVTLTEGNTYSAGRRYRRTMCISCEKTARNNREAHAAAKEAVLGVLQSRVGKWTLFEELVSMLPDLKPGVIKTVLRKMGGREIVKKKGMGYSCRIIYRYQFAGGYVWKA